MSTGDRVTLGSVLDNVQILHQRIINESISQDNSGRISSLYSALGEFELWTVVLQSKRESELLVRAHTEYESAIFDLACGNYRSAFKALRLTLELTLQAVLLSSNELELRHWLSNQTDTSWKKITDTQAGVFSGRFVNAFFPALASHADNYLALATSVYRECSECVHGNTPHSIPLPQTLEFSKAACDAWIEKAEIVLLISSFALAMRYLPDLNESDKSTLELGILARLGHIESIRHTLSGIGA